HRADLPLATHPGHEGAQELHAVDLVRLGAAVAPVDRDRGRIDNMARDPVLNQQAVDPEAVETGFLDDDDHHWRARAPGSRGLQAPEQLEERLAIAAWYLVPRELVAAGRADRHEPARLAEFERGEERVSLELGGGLDRGGMSRHEAISCWNVAASAYRARAAVHPIGSFCRRRLPSDGPECWCRRERPCRGPHRAAGRG